MYYMCAIEAQANTLGTTKASAKARQPLLAAALCQQKLHW